MFKFICGQGAFWGLMAGFVTGVTRMIVDFYYGEPSCHVEDERPLFLQKASVAMQIPVLCILSITFHQKLPLCCATFNQ